MSQQFSRPIPNDTLYFHDLLVLEFYFMLSLQNVYAPIAVVFSLERFLGRIFVGKFPTHGSVFFLFLAARVSRH
jgi:hypothetical protein